MKKALILFSTLSLLAACGSTPAADSTTSPTASSDGLGDYSSSCLDCGFDTVFSLREYQVEEETFRQHYQDAADMFSYYNQLFDIYNNYEGLNNLKTVNDNAGIQAVKVDPVILELLQEAKEFYEPSGGEFDITSGALFSVWHTYRETGITANENNKLGKVPSFAELQEAAQHQGWDCVEINEEESTVYITDPDVSLDVGGIAKGFTVEKIAQMLESEGVTSAAVNAGGNVRTIGTKPDGSPWSIGIQNPGGSGSLFAVTAEGSCSFVTSGDYERYYAAEDGNIYSHIIDPETLFPAAYFHSVSIITDDSGLADCLSTTLFTLDYEEGMALVQSLKEQHPDASLEVIWIMDQEKAPADAANIHTVENYAVVYTDGLKDAIQWIV